MSLTVSFIVVVTSVVMLFGTCTKGFKKDQIMTMWPLKLNTTLAQPSPSSFTLQ